MTLPATNLAFVLDSQLAIFDYRRVDSNGFCMLSVRCRLSRRGPRLVVQLLALTENIDGKL